MSRIAFIGLGNMGGPMSANLVKAGHDVRGFDIVPSKVEQAAAHGVVAAHSNADAAENADVVFTMLPTGREVREVLVEKDKLIETVSGETIVVDTSTTDLKSTEFIHDRAASHGADLVDSPVSGGMAGAEDGTLTFMAGGNPAVIEGLKPIFLAMGKNVVNAGGASAGQAVKVCNNMLLGISMIGACEAIALGEAAGVDHQVLFDVISTSTGNCWSMNVNCPIPDMVDTAPANRGYSPGFTANLMLKDLTLAQEAASKTGVTTQMGEHARALYEQFCGDRNGEMDFSAMLQMVRDMGDHKY